MKVRFVAKIFRLLMWENCINLHLKLSNDNSFKLGGSRKPFAQNSEIKWHIIIITT